MGLLTFSMNVTLDGCVDHQEGIADDETHAFFTHLLDEAGAMLWGRVTYEMMERYWPAVACGDVEAVPLMREWAVKLEAKPKYVVSSTRQKFPWVNSHLISGDLRAEIQKLKETTPAGVLLGSGKLAAELDRWDLIDEYQFLIHPRIVGHGPTLYHTGLPSVGWNWSPRRHSATAWSRCIIAASGRAAYRLTSNYPRALIVASSEKSRGMICHLSGRGVLVA